MNIVLCHDWYSSIDEFLVVLHNALSVLGLKHTVRVTDYRKVFEEMFFLHVNNGRYHKWCQGIKAVNEDTAAELVYAPMSKNEKGVLHIFVCDAAMLRTFTSLAGIRTVYESISTPDEIGKRVSALNQAEEEQVIKGIINDETQNIKLFFSDVRNVNNVVYTASPIRHGDPNSIAMVVLDIARLLAS
jgi:hypothetical protein